MPISGTRRLLVGLVGALALALPAAAQADPAATTITACNGDHMTVAGKVALKGPAARKARGAVLQLRFQALALFGLPQSAGWQVVGNRTKGSGQQAFSGLSFDNWIGLMSWRFVKGSRTVLAGDERSQPGRVGGAKGQANCTLAEGAKPVDKNAPALYVTPDDDVWHHGPATVHVLAQDDFSGVKSITYSLDGGPATPITNGGDLQVGTEAAHTIVWTATDVAGNTTTKQTTLRVDAAPPSKPTVRGPSSVTAFQRPTFAWSPSSDSGSGMHGYVATVRRSDGSIVEYIPVDANTTSVQSPSTLDDQQTYTLTVTAVDNTADTPWTTDSDPYTFRVDTHPDVSSNPPSGSVISGSAKSSGSFTLNLDRPADPSTVTTDNFVWTNVDTNATAKPSSAGCASSPCTTIQLTFGSLSDGRYTLTANNLASDEGVAIPFTGKYAVDFAEKPAATTQTSPGCLTDMNVLTSQPITTNSPGQTIVVNYDYSFSGAGSGEVTVTDSAGGSNHSQAYTPGSSGSDSVNLTLSSSGAHTITVAMHALSCVSGYNFTTSNVVASRTPPP